MKHPILRFLLFFGLAGFVVLWPANYGINSHSPWARLGWALVLLIRAFYVGWATAFLILRPLLTIRKPGDAPLMSAWQGVRTMWTLGRKRPLPRTTVSTGLDNGHHR